MSFGLWKELEVEKWLRPFAARVRMPGYQSQTFKSSRLFFHLYWRLKMLGFTEQEIADHAVAWCFHSKLPKEIALTQAVFELAAHNEIEANEPFMPFTDA